MLDRVKWGPDGLVPAIAQDDETGRVMMLAWMNRQALAATLETGYVHYWSRSRQELWKKGATSGHLQEVVAVRLDCDLDAVLVRIRQIGGAACHTGRESCFFFDAEGIELEGLAGLRGEEVLPRLMRTIEARRGSSPDESWTARLLHQGVGKIGEKIREEAGELVDALEGEGDTQVVHEAADLIYHALVGLAARGLSLADVQRELAGRFSMSGLEEKASRQK